MSAETTRSAPLGTVREDSLTAEFLLAILATAGFFYVNIMAVLVDALVAGLHFSERSAGLVASSNVYGAAGGALLAVFVVTRFPWRKLSVSLLVTMLAIDIASIFTTAPEGLVAIRFVHGLVAGLLVGTAYSVMTHTRSPDRSFGVLLFVQFGLAGVAIWFVPDLIRAYGTAVVFFVLIAFSAVTLALLPFIPGYEGRRAIAASKESASTTHLQRPVVMLAIVLGAIVLFQGSNMAVAAFAIPLGEHYGLEVGSVSRALGIAGWISMFGSVPVILFDTRYGRVLPLIGGMIVIVVSSWVFHFSASWTVYFVASAISGAAWGFVIPYLLGMCAALDPSGRGATLAGFFSKVGLATGPLCGGFLLTHQNYDLLIDVSVAVLAFSTVPGLIAAVALDRMTKLRAQLAVQS